MKKNIEFDETLLKEPIRLSDTRVWRTGRGGRELDKLLGSENPQDSHFPEDWIMSTVQARNVGRENIEDEGLSYLAGTDIQLKEVIKAYPEACLGEAHYRQIGKVPGVLAKIVDTAERTTIQSHPDKETAMRLFHSPFGKTESWHVLSVRKDAEKQPGVYLGFKEGITREKWKQIFDAQDIPAMLGCMHYFPVKPGDTFIIRAGVPHAVSEGFMFFEMQEPTDFTVRTERTSPGGFAINDYQCHQGLGFDKMFDCFHYDGLSEKEASAQYIVPAKMLEEADGYKAWEVVGYSQTNCFQLNRYEVETKVALNTEHVCSGLFVMSGEGVISCNGKQQKLAPGNQFFLSADCGQITISANAGTPLLFFRHFGPELAKA